MITDLQMEAFRTLLHIYASTDPETPARAGALLKLEGFLHNMVEGARSTKGLEGRVHMAISILQGHVHFMGLTDEDMPFPEGWDPMNPRKLEVYRSPVTIKKDLALAIKYLEPYERAPGSKCDACGVQAGETHKVDCELARLLERGGIGMCIEEISFKEEDDDV